MATVREQAKEIVVGAVDAISDGTDGFSLYGKTNSKFREVLNLSSLGVVGLTAKIEERLDEKGTRPDGELISSEAIAGATTFGDLVTLVQQELQ